MKKIINPYAGTSEGLGYNCFACAPENPCGLKMEFYEDDQDVVCFWTPNENHQGWLTDFSYDNKSQYKVQETCAG